ncbi:MAG: hypothetical protein KKD46_06290 [Euryarchaeota archaeon]|nr:hypothetical protein [Euryarchaeota archaeon]
MSTIVGNLERRLAAYAEEQKKSKPKTTQPKRYRGAQQESRLRRLGH